MKKKIIIFLLISNLLLLNLYAAPSSNTEFIIGNSIEPTTLDPSLISNENEHNIYMALFEGLVTYDPRTGLAVPGLAESWTYNQNCTQLTFKLRKAFWSDGTPITAQTVVDSWLRTLNLGTASDYSYMLTMTIKYAEAFCEGRGKASDVGIKAIDNYTFQVDLLYSMPYALDIMTHFAFAVLPMHKITEHGRDWTKLGKIVSNGPFVLSEWKPNEYLTVIRNPNYWDAKNIHLTKIKFLPISDMLTAYNMFKAGDIDWAIGVPLQRIDEIKLRPDYQVGPRNGTYYYLINMARKPLDDVKVRKALALSLDREELVEKITRAGEIPAYSIVPPMHDYTPAEDGSFDPQKARQLLAEAGYADGNNFPSLSILYNTHDSHKAIAEWVVKSWKKHLGITSISLINQDWETYLDTRQNTRDYDIARAGWIGDYLDPNSFLDMYLTNSGLNDGLYNNPQYDGFLRLAYGISNKKTRLGLLYNAEKLLITEDQHLIPLYYYVHQDLIDLNKWDGWFSNPLGVHPWKFIKPKK